MPPAWARHLPAGTDPADVDLGAEGTLPAAWVRRWRERPERRVLHDPAEGWVSAGELLDRSTVAATRLRAAGLAPGDRIVLSGVASAALVVAHVAALRAGLVVVPLNTAASRRELAIAVEDDRPRAALADGPALRESAMSLGHPLVVAGLDGDLRELEGVHGVDSRAGRRGDLACGSGSAGDAASERAPLDAAAPGDPALLPSTSGTTGRPKGALLTHANLLASAEAVRIAWRWDEPDVLLLCLPLFHMHGLGVGLHGSLLSGGAAVLRPRFDADEVLETCAGGTVTMFFGVPTMYHRLAEAERPERLGALRLCVSGSAPLSADLHRAIKGRCGQVVLERYGMTETVMLVSNPYDGERRPGTVGFPLPGVDVRLAEDTSEILVRGPNVFSGYYGRPEETEASFTADGWFRTGDVGAFDADGYLRIVGRTKELILSGGYNVYPREVEDVLRAHPAVIDAAVVGTPSEEWGETVTAYVEARDPFDPDELLGWAASQLAPYKKPRIVHRVGALPRNALGKVVRDELRPPPG